MMKMEVDMLAILLLFLECLLWKVSLTAYNVLILADAGWEMGKKSLVGIRAHISKWCNL